MIKAAEDLLAWCYEQRAQASAALALYEAGELSRWPGGSAITESQMGHLRRIVVRLDRLIEEAENA